MYRVYNDLPGRLDVEQTVKFLRRAHQWCGLAHVRRAGRSLVSREIIALAPTRIATRRSKESEH